MNKIALLFGLACGLTVRADIAPEIQNALREENPRAALRALADARIAQIRATANRAIPAGAACYYLDAKNGNDAADGRTPQSAWKTTARLAQEKIAPGSYVLYARGGIYRGTVPCRPGVTYTAYGEGPKPCIYGSPADGADPAKWARTDNPNVWAYQLDARDVGTLVFDGGKAHARKVVFRTDKKTGAKFSMVTGRPFNSYRDLDTDLHFWHDYYKDGTKKVYLYSAQNPGERFRSIEFNVKCHGFGVGGAGDVTIDNFTVKYVGVHGVGAGTCRNLTVSNCEFAWIGGSIQAEGIFGRDHPTRLGNAVEIYGGCDGYVVTNCCFAQVYDAGVTHQFNIPNTAGEKRYDEKNVVFADNVFDTCNYSIEYFLTAPDGNASRMENLLYANNLMFDAGRGFCEQRPDRDQGAHIKAWFHGNRNRAKNYVVRNNVFCGAGDMLVQICAGLKNLDGSSSLPTMADNVFVGRAGQQFGMVSDTSDRRETYGPGTQAYVDRFGPGNRCVFVADADVVMCPDGDVRTIQGALEQVRALRASGAIPAGRVAEVRVEAGRYSVAEPATFTPADSSVRFTAAQAGAATFDGGVALPAFTAGADGIWRAPVPAGLRFEQLYVNGVRAQRARMPNAFYLYMRDPWEGGNDPRTGKPADLERHAFFAERKDAAALAALPADELKDVEVLFWQSWDQARAKVDYVDGKSGLVIAKTPAGRPLFFWSSTRPRFAFENLRSALDAPGEWFHDRKAGELLYIPRPGETVAATRAVAPVAPGFVRFAGDPLKGDFVRDVAFDGLAFEHGAWIMPETGAPNAQSAQNIREAAVFGDGVTGFRMENCRIAHVGAHGVWLKRGCRNCVVRHCRIEDLGGGGVYLGDTADWREEKRARLSGFNKVEDNIVRNGGRTFNGAIGVWIGHASDNVIAHNDIGDFRYTGVSMGWCWGYHETVCHRNLLLWNRIHHIGQGVLSDMGGVYTLGNSEGTVEMGNWIHDVNGYAGAGSPAWGLYTDEGSRGIHMVSNLVERCRDGAVHQHYGQDNVWANNIFATFDRNGVWRSRIENHTTVIVTNNVFWWTNPDAHVLSGPKGQTVKDVVFEGNLYWGVNGVATNAFGGRTLAEWQGEGHDLKAQFADPQFADAANRDWRMAESSPARKMGFVPWDWTFAGVLKDDAAWRAAAMDDSAIPALVDAPKAPKYARVAAHQDFEGVRVGETRKFGAVGPAGKEGFVVVQEGRNGGRALKLTDGPQCKCPWDPHLITRVLCETGSVRIAFAFKVDAAARPQFECRDYDTPDGSPYAVGPSLHIVQGVLQAQGRELGRVAPGTWCDVEVLLHVTGEKAKTWDCTVKPAGGEAKTTTGLRVQKNFRVLEWVGFMTNGREPATWWLDDFRVDPAEPALGGFGGSLELTAPGVLLQPCLRPNNWTARYPLEDGFDAPVKDAHAFYFVPDARKDGPVVRGTARFRSTADGGVAATWTMASGARVVVGADLRLPQWQDGALETDAGTVALAATNAFGQVFDRDVRSVAVKDAAGAVRLRLDFPRPVRARLSKERDWGLVKYDLRFSLGDVSGTNRLDAVIHGGGALAFREEGPQTIVAGKDWIPFAAAIDVKAGSALDFSSFRGTDAPAGRYGAVVAKGEHFEFEKRPGVPVRFYGINVCGDANCPSPEESKAFAATLRKLGYNAIRFHHHESSLVKPDAAKGSTELDPQAMARFDALVAACVENGIYLTTDLFVSRAPIAYRSIGIDRDGNVQMNEFKYLVQVHEGAHSNYVAFARNFLSHVNPHTGRRYADEPALALLSLVNEGNMSGVQWAGRTFGLLKDYSKEAMAACEAKFAARMRKFLREEMGYRGLLTNMNNYFWDDDPPGEKVRAEQFDYSDDHFYVDHPRFIGRDWRLPSSCPNTNPLQGADLGTQRLASTRPRGLPFTITEYNFSGPGRFRGVGGILTGALGARQDWAGLLRFAWSHGKYGLTHAKELGYFDMSGDPLGLAAERASICLFLRGDLAPAEPEATFLFPPAKVADTKRTPGSLAPYWALDWAAWGAKIGTTVADRAPAGTEVLATYPDAPSQEAEARLRALPTGGVKIDPKAGAFTLDTPRTCGGFAEGGRVAAGPFQADLGTVPATIWASSLDGAPVASARHLLLTHLTDVQNSGIRYADAGLRILLDWGRGPHLMRAGKAQVSLAVAAGDWKVWALAPSGERVRQVAATYADGRLAFTADVAADPANATFLYELER